MNATQFSAYVVDESLDRTNTDAICDAFESAWRRGDTPAIEDFLSEANLFDSSSLLRHLIEIELWWRREESPPPNAAAYKQRFANNPDAVDAAWKAFHARTLGQSDRLVNDDVEATLPVGINLPPSFETPTLPPERDTGQSIAVSGDRVRYFGEYELLEEIARGGMGVVFKARQVKLNRIVAVKMILSGQLAGDEEVKRFQTEAEAAANLDHPGIVPIYEIGEHERQHYFSMGFVEGESLQDKLRDGPLNPKEAAELCRKVTEAIAYAHDKRVIHRDLKPANVLLDSNGEPRVTDFGLAKQVESDSDLTGTGAVMGTPSYMPPEQASGKTDEVGPRADVYSLGAILYCLLTGRPPFQAASTMDVLLQVLEQDPVSPRQLVPKIDKDLETICLKCLEKDQSKRYESAVELVEDLTRYLDGRPITARPVSQSEQAWRWCRRNRILTSSILAVGTVVLLAAIYLKIVSTERLVDRLIDTDVAKLPFLVEQLDANYLWARPFLKTRLNNVKESGDRRQELHIQVALARFDAEHANELIWRLGECNADYLMLLKDRLRPHKDRILDRLWFRFKGASHRAGEARMGTTTEELPSGGSRAVRDGLNSLGRNAGLLLAEYAPTADNWTQDDAAYLVGEVYKSEADEQLHFRPQLDRIRHLIPDGVFIEMYGWLEGSMAHESLGFFHYVGGELDLWVEVEAGGKTKRFLDIREHSNQGSDDFKEWTCDARLGDVEIEGRNRYLAEKGEGHYCWTRDLSPDRTETWTLTHARSGRVFMQKITGLQPLRTLQTLPADTKDRKQVTRSYPPERRLGYIVDSGKPHPLLTYSFKRGDELVLIRVMGEVASQL